MIIPSDICKLIFSYFPKKTAYNRLDADLLIKFSLVSKLLQQVVYSGVESFDTRLKWDKTKSFRWFIGEINRENTKLMKCAFRHLNAPDAHPEQSPIADYSPFLQNCKGEALIDIVISKRNQANVRKSAPTLTFLLSRMSIKELKEYFPKFINQPIDHDVYIALLNCVFVSFVQKTNEMDAKEFFQDHLGKKMHELTLQSNKKIIYDWMISKDMVLNMEDLVYYFSNGFTDGISKTKEALQLGRLDFINSNGDRLIHALLKGTMSANVLLSHLKSIHEISPSEIRVKDKVGKSAISYIFDAPACKGYNYHKSQMQYDYTVLSGEIFTPNLLWDLREECFETLIEYIKKDMTKVLQRRSEQPLIFLERIKRLLPDEFAFISWLNEPYGLEKKVFRDELFIWNRSLYRSLYKNFQCNRYIQLPKNENLHDLVYTLSDISNFSSDHCKLMENYPGLEESLRLQLFRKLFESKFDEDFKEMNTVFGTEWFQYKDADGNTLLHYMFSEKASNNTNNQVQVAETIVYMIDNGLNLNHEERKSLIELARANRWHCAVDLL